MGKEHNCCCGEDNLEKDKCCESEEMEGCECGDENECGDDNECGCGCGCGGHDFEEGDDTITVTFEDGVEKECVVLAIIEVDKKEYIALLPEDQEEYFIYGYEEDEEGVELIAIESDDEFEKVSGMFEELFDQELEELE
jgi:uncharacterized protein YrzB (UPF0473 family)